MVTADALKAKVCNLFSNNKTGSVSFRDSEDTEEISSWKKFCCHAYLPKGYVFSSNKTDKKGAVWLMDEKTIMMKFIN